MSRSIHSRRDYAPGAGEEPGIRRRRRRVLPYRTTSAAETPRLDVKDPAAVALGYVENAEQVDAKKYPSYVKGSNCENCLLLQGSSGPDYRPCSFSPARWSRSTAGAAAGPRKYRRRARVRPLRENRRRIHRCRAVEIDGFLLPGCRARPARRRSASHPAETRFRREKSRRAPADSPRAPHALPRAWPAAWRCRSHRHRSRSRARSPNSCSSS